MRAVSSLLAAAIVSTVVAFGADAPGPSLGKILDGQIKSVEGETVSLAEAMPADMYNFAPTNGEFKDARTFSQQMSHIAAVVYMVSAAALGEKNPSEAGSGENGPAYLKDKAAVVKYLKDAFTYAHKAANAVTVANMLDPMQSPFGQGKMARIACLSIATSHSFDHYGQAVIYARMNGIIPPASRAQ